MSDRRSLSRAEQVRRRRAEQAAKELQETKTRAIKPMVKVTSRTPTIPMAAMQKQAVKKQKESRRFNVALGLPQIHLHKPNFSMPSMPKFHANWRMASVVITLLFGIAIYLALSLPYFYIPAATVLGSNRLSREEINGVLGVTGQSIFTIQPGEVRERLLLNYPELLSAEVKVYLPNHVYVTVVERQPVV
ncbi:MAG: FtsQ-type POTRA domain-containing protein, partial [Anaerolineales bacterium]|nr:FtsQ-type POTRA domain-containing protein [Anaerolineales bacterium]